MENRFEILISVNYKPPNESIDPCSMILGRSFRFVRRVTVGVEYGLRMILFRTSCNDETTDRA